MSYFERKDQREYSKLSLTFLRCFSCFEYLQEYIGSVYYAVALIQTFYLYIHEGGKSHLEIKFFKKIYILP